MEPDEGLAHKEEFSIPIEMAGEEVINDEIDENDSDEDVDVEAELSSPTDDDDPAWAFDGSIDSEDELYEGFVEEVGIEDDVTGNPDLKASEGFSDGMVGRTRKSMIEDELLT